MVRVTTGGSSNASWLLWSDVHVATPSPSRREWLNHLVHNLHGQSGKTWIGVSWAESNCKRRSQRVRDTLDQCEKTFSAAAPSYIHELVYTMGGNDNQGAPWAEGCWTH